MERSIRIILLILGWGFSMQIMYGLTFTSSFLSLGFSPKTPAFSSFSVDSLGGGALKNNVVLSSKVPAGDCALRSNGGNQFEYVRQLVNGQEAVLWQITLENKRIILRSDFVDGVETPAFLLSIDQKRNHATLLGNLLPNQRRTRLPCVLHFPDMGTFRISATDSRATLGYDALRGAENFVTVEIPPATKEEKTIEYTWDVTLIYPDLPGLANNPLYDGYRRNFLNLIQVNPRLHSLANNSSSDSAALCFWQYSELGLKAPPLAPGLTVLGLVRMSLDRVLDGGLTYGQVGYHSTAEYPEAAPWGPTHDSADNAPSILIAGCQYIQGSGDLKWAATRFDLLAAIGRKMLAKDTNGDGLIKDDYSGNSGSWKDTDRTVWWDSVGFGYENAFSNALAYRACVLMGSVALELGRTADATEFSAAAGKIKAAYYPAFYNPQTGVLAGWKSADGVAHDYFFTSVNGMAISFGLIADKEANSIMDKLVQKMAEVDYNRFDLGLPGNLVPIRKGDYIPCGQRFGAPSLDDGSDTFQIYENGGATACQAYWTVKALYRLGRVQDARRIYYPMLKSFAEGSFQGMDPNNMAADWKDWKGNFHGYEGFLSDGYLALLAVEDDVQAGAPK